MGIRSWASRVYRAATSSAPSREAGLFWPTSQGDTLPRGTSDILNAYAALPWLRAVTGRIGQAISSVDWQLYAVRQPQQRATLEPWLQRAHAATRRKAIQQLISQDGATEIKNHPLLDTLHAGNDTHTGVQLWRATQTAIDLVGESFWLKARNALGAPAALWCIPPTWVDETPTPGRQTYKLNLRGRRAELPAEEIVWFADPNPANPYGRGTGLASTLGDELATDEYAAKLVRTFFTSGARPDFIVSPKSADGGIDKSEIDRFRNEWVNRHQGYSRGWEPYMAGQELNVHEFSKDFQSMQLTELRRYERDTIIQVYGVPPELLGVVENSNRATIESAEYIFTRWVLVPRLELLRSILQERLVPDYDERLVIDYASPVPADSARQLAASQAAPYTLTVNEWRSLQGLPKIPDGEVKMVPPNLIPMGRLDEEPEPMIEEPPPPTFGPPAAPKPPAMPMPGAGQDAA